MTRYKLKMMFSDRLFFTAMLLIPLFITVATGYALRYEKLGVIPVAIVDEDDSEYSGIIVGRLSEKEGMHVEAVPGDEARKLLEDNAVEAVFILLEGFEERIVAGDTDGLIEMLSSPSSYSAGYIREVIAGEAIRFITANLAADWVEKRYGELGIETGDLLRGEVIAYNEGQWEPEPLMTIEYRELQGTEAELAERATMPAATATSTGIITVFIMFYILFGSGWLVEERVNGTLKRLMAGPGALGLSYAGNILALLVSGLLQVMLFAAVDRLLFGVELLPGLPAYGVFIAYLLSVISLSLFLSSVFRTPAQLQATAPLTALLTGFAGGCFWNFVEMPERLQALALLTPQGWALKGINGLLLNPSDVSAAVLPILVLAAVSLILIPVSYIILHVQAAK